jgi:hypothetical protein
VGSFIICTHHWVSLSDQIKQNEVGRECGMHGKGENIIQGFGGKV